MTLVPQDIFDTIRGLPVHPLVDHVAVVFLPLSTLALIALIVVPPLRRRYGSLTMVGLVIGTVSAFAAKESGERLAARVGLPRDHARWGDVLPWVALATTAVGFLWYVIVVRAGRRNRNAGIKARSVVSPLVGGLAGLLALVATVLTVIVGDQGARAVWADRVVAVAPTSSAPTASASPSSTTGASAAATSSASASQSPASTPPGGSAGSQAPGTYTKAQVGQHNSQASCWTIINGNVYDLTKWISQHPGGPERIIALCGIDGTTAYTAQHGGQAQPTAELATFQIGVLAS